ncbi:adenosylcobinamide-GDP ribazoletransferase [Methanothermobacter thermautotrophicus]|jgi:adenosylcobinamide-GDP ribazoletransferase|uniref:Adenosylcobinamide-GDP ribazoletransferase n=1 Tax=Methanothermobacter thermautotrophicus TaxID=145262 RepID=A0A842YQ91_METTF|nr:adenosylcobinamide-GDP ribazoletransferase [Methanothermobacter thermautotrophicus]MBE2900284.1 adenosylcobinamide-GDP ribazoletransferase [Methanothermobacter thermautotrophicus]MDN5374365.1 adenosylcobinamide-GDP ribazoletransferase [Methanothermobacter sp.]HOQ18956.1 adenosylcobinamide-GDP ribazoletransferase [Methanothermobacter thermautotrophicus]
MRFTGKLRGLISFSTIVPLRSDATVEDIASLTLHWPLVGALIGVAAGSVALVTSLLLPGAAVACVAYGFSIWFTGFHHLDGLIDMGDALMSHGSFERKIEIMRDSRIGTGGLGLLVLVSSTTIAAVYSLPHAMLFQGLLIGEFSAKVCLTGCALVSRPLDSGTGRHFILAARNPLIAIVWIFWAAVAYILVGVPGAVAVAVAVISGIFIGLVARRNFYWSTGDVLGASNEMGRMMSLLGLLAAIRLGV